MSTYWMGCSTATPSTFFTQDEIFEKAKYSDFPQKLRDKIEAIFRLASVQRRGIYVPHWGLELSDDPDEFHARYVGGVREMAPRAISRVLDSLGWSARDLDFLVFTSCTGFTCPGFSVELAEMIGMRRDRPTANLVGMGCSALVPALRTGRDHLQAVPGSRGLVVSAEICSSMYWVDETLEMAVGNATFGDGAAAIALSSRQEDAEFALARVDGFKNLRDGRYLEDMGFTQKSGRLRLKLSRELPDHVAPMALEMVEMMELPVGARVAFHPGGRKILDMLAQALPAPEWQSVIQWSRKTLQDFGNLSSATAAFVLERSLRDRPVRVGEAGGIITMGPGISVEGMRMSWLRAPV